MISRLVRLIDIEPREQVAADQTAADQPKQHHQQQSPGQRRREQLLGLVAFGDIARNEQLEPARQGEYAAARAVLCNSFADAALDNRTRRYCRSRIAIVWPSVEIADDRPLVRIGEQIKRLRRHAPSG